MDDKASAPPAYPGTESGDGGNYNTNYQTEYADQKCQGEPPAYPDSQPLISPPAQQMMHNSVMDGRYGSAAYKTVPHDYTTQAWLACLCCFWPIGIIAIMKASESRSALARGDMVGANEAANSARKMVRISFIVGIISVIFTGIIYAVYFKYFFTVPNRY